MKPNRKYLPYYFTLEETIIHKNYDCEFYNDCLSRTLSENEKMSRVRGKIHEQYIKKRDDSLNKKERVLAHYWRVAELERQPMVRSFSCSKCDFWKNKFDLKKIRHKIEDELNEMGALEQTDSIKDERKALRKILKRLELSMMA